LPRAGVLMIELLAQITAPKPRQFTAGLVLWDDVVVNAAPIIHFMKREKWTRNRVREYCEAKGWNSRGTSVLPSTADIVRPARHVRKVPCAEVATASRMY
jgi:hypothetical protein